jgi:hypothetical protein
MTDATEVGQGQAGRLLAGGDLSSPAWQSALPFRQLTGAKRRNQKHCGRESFDIESWVHSLLFSSARKFYRSSIQMHRLSLALLILLFGNAVAFGQSVARLDKSANLIPENETRDERVLAARTIAALKRLDSETIVYRSLGDFEAEGKLARVSFAQFANDLQEVTNEVEPMLSHMPQSRLKTEITNALYSYRDGASWWEKIDQPRVVHVSALTSTETRTSSDSAFLATVPYTVAINWRQANRYLKRAEELLDGSRK